MLRSIHPKARPAHHERKVIMASIKKTGNNSYQITVSCGYDSAGKKIRRKTTYKPELLTTKGNPKSEASIEKDVVAFAADFERKVLTGQYTAGHTMTFEKYAGKYLTECAEETQAPRTLQSTRSAVAEFIDAFGYMALENLTPLYLQEYVNSLLKRKKTGGSGATLSYSTVKRKAAVLSAMLSQAVRWNLLSTNPMARVQIKNQTTGSAPQGPKCFTQEQAEKFLLLLDNVQTYAYGSRSRIDTAGKIYQVSEYQSARTVALQLKFLFYLAMFTGCRRGELLALQWSDLDFDKGSVSISKSLCYADGKKIIKPTKTNHDRSISIPQIVLTLGKQWKHEQNLYRLSIGSQWINEDNVFIRWNGDSMGLDTPYKAFHRILKHYNATRQQDEPALPLIPFHGLRHTAATLLIANGVNIRTVSGRLGHTNTSTTLNIYSHALEEFDRKASDVLADTLMKKA